VKFAEEQERRSITMALIISLAVIIIFVLTALALGHDSRDGNDWAQHPRP
jgi:hypothetical protein